MCVAIKCVTSHSNVVRITKCHINDSTAVKKKERDGGLSSLRDTLKSVSIIKKYENENI
jgi:hypothetical protein